MILIDTNKSTIFNYTKNSINKSNVKSSKILCQQSCGIDYLTRSYGSDLNKSCHIVYDAIKAVCHHVNEKVFDSYSGCYQSSA